jgi:NADH dehydrogenase (ubiquinone) 1 beta subcomplex subunit 9
MLSPNHKLEVCSLYRKAVRLARDWYVAIDLWRSKAVEIRQQFDMNKNVTNPEHVQKLIQETKDLLEEYRHPSPYVCKLKKKIREETRK